MLWFLWIILIFSHYIILILSWALDFCFFWFSFYLFFYLSVHFVQVVSDLTSFRYYWFRWNLYFALFSLFSFRRFLYNLWWLQRYILRICRRRNYLVLSNCALCLKLSYWLRFLLRSWNLRSGLLYFLNNLNLLRFNIDNCCGYCFFRLLFDLNLFFWLFFILLSCNNCSLYFWFFRNFSILRLLLIILFFFLSLWSFDLLLFRLNLLFYFFL